MLVLLTSANYPDVPPLPTLTHRSPDAWRVQVMMSAYNKDRAAGLFFVSFLLIGMFFLLNFVLALVSNLYAEQVGALLQLPSAQQLPDCCSFTAV